MTTRYTDVGAIVSDCGRYRYRLWRRWGDGGQGSLVFIMLNPSTADGEQDDPTIRKCVGFAKRAGYRGIEIINLFAYRATKPADLKASGYQIGPQNDTHIKAVLSIYQDVVVAWGTNADCGAGWLRVRRVMEMVADAYIQPSALKLTANGIPWHPLMLGYETEWVPYRLKGHDT